MRAIVQLSQINSAVPGWTHSRDNGNGTVTLYYGGEIPDPINIISPEELAAEQAAVIQTLQDIVSAKAYAKLKALSQMTPAQVQVWVAANVTNLAQAQDAITTLAIAVSVLFRKL